MRKRSKIGTCDFTMLFSITIYYIMRFKLTLNFRFINFDSLPLVSNA